MEELLLGKRVDFELLEGSLLRLIRSYIISRPWLLLVKSCLLNKGSSILF